MPSLYAHYYFGRKVLPLLDQDLRNLIQTEQDLFDIGQQGPDLFFYGGILHGKAVNQFGHKLHQQSAKQDLSQILRGFSLKKNQKWAGISKPELVYILGFIGHFTLDACCHPFVFEVQDNIETHLALETDFDQLLLSANGEIPFRYNLSKHCPKDAHTKNAIANVYQAFSDEISRKKVKASVNALNLLRKLLRVKSNFKYNFYEKGMKVLGLKKHFGMVIPPIEKEESVKNAKDYARYELENSKKILRFRLAWPEKSERFLPALKEKFENAIPQYKENIEAFLRYIEQGIELPKFFERNFD